tara:strand:+ start:352 stop:1275 length:924 start_codon:yes stop_codon:yes gene_type:complete
MKFLITGAHGDIAQSIFRILKLSYKKAVIDGTDIRKSGPNEFLFNKIHEVNSPSNKNYLKYIKEISKNYQIIIPTTEDEIIFFSENLNKFKNTSILINSPEIINTFSNQLKTHAFLKKKNFSVPNFCLRLNDIKKFSNIFFLKKNFGHGNQGYKIINNHKEFNKLNTLNKKNWIAQEFLDHNYKEYTCAVTQLGKFRDVIILNRKLNQGYTYFVQEVKNLILKNTLLVLAKKINLNGSINVQLKINNSRYAIFEINPRLSSTVMMRHKLGFKDCLWWIEYILNNKLPKNKYKIKNRKLFKFFDEKFI